MVKVDIQSGRLSQKRIRPMGLVKSGKVSILCGYDGQPLAIRHNVRFWLTGRQSTFTGICWRHCTNDDRKDVICSRRI